MTKTNTLAEQMTLKLGDVLTYIDPEELTPNPYQPPGRIDVPEEEARTWYDSIESNGLFYFPIVREAHPAVGGKYQVGDGWLRRAGYLYGWKQENQEKYSRLPCVVKELTDQNMADLALESNQKRKDYDPIQTAWIYKKYLEDFGVTQAELAASRSISQGAVANTIRLLELPDDVQAKIISREISSRHGRELLRLNDRPDMQKKMAETCVKDSLSVDDLNHRISNDLYNKSKSLDPKKAWGDIPKFDIKGCQGCPHAETLLREPRCLDPKCWQEKQDAARAVETKKLKEELGAQGIERVYESGQLKYNEYDFLYDSWLEKYPECRTCAHRAALNSINGQPTIVCIDTECYKQKKEQASEEARVESERKQRETGERIDRAVEGLTDMTLAMRTIILNHEEYWDELVALLGIEVPDEEPDDYDLEAIIEEKLKTMELPDLIKLMLRLTIKSRYPGDREKILEKLEASAGITPAKPESELGAIQPEPEAELVASEPVIDPALGDMPCNYCLDRDTCDRSYFYFSEEAKKIVCDKRRQAAVAETRQDSALDFEAIKSAAKAESAEIWKKKATEGIFKKSVRCPWCGEKHIMEFKLDPEEKTEHHWVGSCPKCGEKNSVKNARWDGMYGLEKSEAKEEPEDEKNTIPDHKFAERRMQTAENKNSRTVRIRHQA